MHSLGSEKSATPTTYTDSSAEAYNAYAIVSALVFGASVNSFTNVAGIVADSDQYTSAANQDGQVDAYADARPGGSVIIWLFCSMLALVCCLSGYSTAFMTLQYYSCKILLERAHPERLRAFLHVTWRPRQLARHATWAAMALYLSALAVLAFEILPWEAATLTCAIMGAGVTGIVLVWCFLTREFERHLRTGTTGFPELSTRAGSAAEREHLVAAGVAPADEGASARPGYTEHLPFCAA